MARWPVARRPVARWPVARWPVARWAGPIIVMVIIRPMVRARGLAIGGCRHRANECGGADRGHRRSGVVIRLAGQGIVGSAGAKSEENDPGAKRSHESKQERLCHLVFPSWRYETHPPESGTRLEGRTMVAGIREGRNHHTCCRGNSSPQSDRNQQRSLSSKGYTHSAPRVAHRAKAVSGVSMRPFAPITVAPPEASMDFATLAILLPSISTLIPPARLTFFPTKILTSWISVAPAFTSSVLL